MKGSSVTKKLIGEVGEAHVVPTRVCSVSVQDKHVVVEVREEVIAVQSMAAPIPPDEVRMVVEQRGGALNHVPGMRIGLYDQALADDSFYITIVHTPDNSAAEASALGLRLSAASHDKWLGHLRKAMEIASQ